MPDTLEDVLQDVAAYINQDPTTPTGTDLTMWTRLVNQSQNEWADSFNYRRILGRPYEVPVTASMTSIGLPVTFKKLLSPVFDKTLSSNNEYLEIMPIDKNYKTSTDKYVVKYGDSGSGQYLLINPALGSGASITFDYLATPSAMATLNATVTCPSRQFLVLRTISKILSARSDPRFPQVQIDSEDLLLAMQDNEAAATGGQDNQTPSRMRRTGYRIGEQ